MVVKIHNWTCPRCNKSYPPFDEDGNKTHCESCDAIPKSVWVKVRDWVGNTLDEYF
jgi:PHP family Zn ribbon phosphoesterase